MDILALELRKELPERGERRGIRMADGQRRALLADGAAELPKLAESVSRGFGVVQEDRAIERWDSRAASDVEGYRVHAGAAVDKVHAAFSQRLHDGRHQRPIRRGARAHVVVRAARVRDRSHVRIHDSDDLIVRHPNLDRAIARHRPRSRFGLHGQVEHHFAAGAVGLLCGLPGVRQARQNRKRQGVGQLEQLAGRLEILSQVIDHYRGAQQLPDFAETPGSDRRAPLEDADLNRGRPVGPVGRFRSGFETLG